MTDYDPLVSVIIPCWQAEKTLASTLEDILSQSYSNIEIIAVNDGSTDDTKTILKKYQDKIKVISLSENKGASAARNLGFRNSNGEYILFCDADVKLKNTMIEKMLKKLQSSPQHAYCYCNFKFGPHTFDLFPFDGAKLLQENYISTMSLIRKEKFIGFDESLKRFQDWDLWKRMYHMGFTGVWFNERLFSAPLQKDGISKIDFKRLYTLFKRKINK